MFTKIRKFLKENPFILILLIIFLLGTVAYIAYLIIYNTNNANEQKMYEELQAETFVDVEPVNADKAEGTSEDAGPYMSVEEFLALDNNENYREYLLGKRPDFQVLRKNNKDVVAYLLIPDTKISYPVMLSEDNSFYLKHNMDGSEGYPGCLYIENYNSPDFNDSISIIYGHNMRNNSMFGTLDKFGQEAYRQEHPYIFLYLPDEIRVYELVVAGKYSDEHLLIDSFTKEDEDTYVFNGFDGSEGIRFVNDMSEYGAKGTYVNSGQLTENDRLLVLSTCSGDNMRYIVGAKRVL